MFIALFGAVESGVIYAIMALGVYLSFRVLDFPDLTVDGSFVTGAGITGVLIVNGTPPVLATLIGALAGFIAGCITGILHTAGKINALLSGILMMIALYSINLRFMGQPTVSLLNESTLVSQIESLWASTGIDSALNGMLNVFELDRVPTTWAILIMMAILTLAIKFLLDYFLKTEIGLAIRATGDNQKMIRSLSANTNFLIIIGIGLSNGLVALSGALIGQHGGFANLNMGIGMIVIGLASVIIGEALFGKKTITRVTLAVIGGAIIYRVVVTVALRVDYLSIQSSDLKLITAILVIAALVTPKILQARKDKKRRQAKRAALMEQQKESEASA
ncbi:ABC transporter permease [Tenuibacillus multivorans]|uniref:Putative ABC transport system permease protein n=1 Tax=Tenuibacillus multivorans TaxID=237069 RepID=A0A1H0BWW8_9BACI|nr:ABC transporter permease [Tenuibacillus multivorans]GEL77007.1 ABC transporter permease [Tenuibacillus multivorans]SDN49970.1 putative ABC transport system permease protein [Tenuibacillus multivorans]